MSEQKTPAEKIAELHEIAARVKALRDTLPADSRGLGGVAFQVEQMCGHIEAAIKASEGSNG